MKPYKRTTRRTVTKTPPPVVAKDERKALHLPMFGPGIPISVPLHLLPAYLDLYRLHVMTRKEIFDLSNERGIRKSDGIVWVHRDGRATTDEPKGKDS
jgi:hypothetical protein